MALSGVVGLGGPVGFLLASVGYAVSVTMARTFVSLESHCVQACPVVRIEGFQFHHFYYGLILSAVSLGMLLLSRRQRVRWDASLFFGMGIGLMADETGFLFLGTTYDSTLSFFIVGLVAAVFVLAMFYTALTAGLRDFKSLDRADVLTFASIVLVILGMVIFDRPFRFVLEVVGVLAWSTALVLLGLHGGTHMRKLRLTSGPKRAD